MYLHMDCNLHIVNIYDALLIQSFSDTIIRATYVLFKVHSNLKRSVWFLLQSWFGFLPSSTTSFSSKFDQIIMSE